VSKRHEWVSEEHPTPTPNCHFCLACCCWKQTIAAMSSSPLDAPIDKENVQDTSQTPEENMTPVVNLEDKQDSVTVGTEAESEVKTVTSPFQDEEENDALIHDDDGLLKDVDIEEGRLEMKQPGKKRSVAMRDPAQMGVPPPRKTKPVWLWILLILAVLSLVGAITIIIVSAVQGGLTKVALGFLIFFGFVLVCCVPYACFTRAQFFAMGMVH
jgi:hypothetical protein